MPQTLEMETDQEIRALRKKARKHSHEGRARTAAKFCRKARRMMKSHGTSKGAGRREEMPKSAHRSVTCDSDRCGDCRPYGEHCDECGRRVCKLVSVDCDDHLICLDCARDTLLFCLAIGLERHGLEEQVNELERRELVRIGPFRGVE